MDEKAIEDMIKNSRAHWDRIDVEELAPIFHGPPPSEAQRSAAAARMKKVEELQKAYEAALLREKSAHALNEAL